MDIAMDVPQWEDEDEDDDSSCADEHSVAPSDEDEQAEDDLIVRFGREVRHTVLRGLQENHSVDDTLLEINGLKFSFNAAANDCSKAILPAVLEFVENKNLEKSTLVLAELKKTVVRWKALLVKFLRSTSERADFLRSLEDFSAESKTFKPLFQDVLYQLYDIDILPEDTILSWAAIAAKAPADSNAHRFLQQSKSFLEWLQTAEEEDEVDDEG